MPGASIPSIFGKTCLSDFFGKNLWTPPEASGGLFWPPLACQRLYGGVRMAYGLIRMPTEACGGRTEGYGGLSGRLPGLSGRPLGLI